jgi:Barstar (barnase inhibitor)
MNIVQLDAKNWKTVANFYEALLAALGMPEEYGCNINSLLEAMVWDYGFAETTAWHDRIKAVHAPYQIQIYSAKGLPKDIREEIEFLEQALPKAREEFQKKQGRDVDVSLKVIS